MLSGVVVLFVAISMWQQSPVENRPIPPELRELDYQQCYRPCREGFEHLVCERLCTCSMDQMQERFDLEAYLTMRAEMSKNEVSEATREKLDSIALYCTAELDAAGIEVRPVGEDGEQEAEEATPPGR